MTEIGWMVPDAVAGHIERYLEEVQALAGGRVEAVYAVGSLALGDYSDRQSNIDLVVAGSRRLDDRLSDRLTRARAHLDRPRHPAVVWYATWEDIAEVGLAGGGPGGGAPGGASSAVSPLATPLTRAILRQDPVALVGPDWPVVAHDPDELRAWSSGRLRTLVARSPGLLVLRRAVSPLVLETARLAQAALTGRVLSKSAAGNAAVALVVPSHRRILVDSVGYRRGAQTSMYWGPFERKYDALAVVRELGGLVLG